VQRSGCVLADAGDAKAAIIATGAEVPFALPARKERATEGAAVRVVSMPSSSVFDRQDEPYSAAILQRSKVQSCRLSALRESVAALITYYVGELVTHAQTSSRSRRVA
jgi:transketolase